MSRVINLLALADNEAAGKMDRMREKKAAGFTAYIWKYLDLQLLVIFIGFYANQRPRTRFSRLLLTRLLLFSVTVTYVPERGTSSPLSSSTPPYETWCTFNVS